METISCKQVYQLDPMMYRQLVAGKVSFIKFPPKPTTGEPVIFTGCSKRYKAAAISVAAAVEPGCLPPTGGNEGRECDFLVVGSSS